MLCNLLFMLTVFLCSEGVKGYKASFAYVLLGMGVLQILRIFILPMRAHSALITINKEELVVMQSAQFVRVIVYLVASAACCFVAGLVGIHKSRVLAAHMAALEQKAA